MTDEYDPEELENLVTKALENIEESTNYALFSFGDTRLLAHLETILPEHVSRGEVQIILDSLRSKLYEGLAGHKENNKALRSIHGAVSRCRVCPNMKPDPQLPKWNVVDPDIMFLQNMPVSGSDADKFFVAALKDAGFRSSRLCVTSVVRCYPQENRQPEAEEISACTTRYLFSEIQLMKPQLVVALGGLPAGVLLGGQIKITEERGNLFWVGPWPVLATYSPAYAIRTDRQSQELSKDIQRAYEFLYGK